MNEPVVILSEMTETEKIAQKGRMDLYFFAKHILGYEDMQESPHNTEMCQWVYDVLGRPRDLQNGLNKCPRSTFKSTLYTIAFSCWLLVQDKSNPLIPIYGPDVRILIDSETFTKAAVYLDAIKSHLRDSYFQSLYGDIITGSTRDREGELIVTTRKKTLKEGTIECSGVGKAKTGMHYDFIFFDDLVSPNNIQTQDQLNKVASHFTLSFALLDPGGMVFVNGTAWHQDDIYIRIENDMAEQFLVRIFDSVNDDLEDILTEEPTWYFFPERLTLTYLRRQRHILGPTPFAAQYRNRPMASEEQIFRPQMIKFNGDMLDAEKDSVLPRPLHKFMAVDPSMGENPGNDDTGIVVIGVDRDNNWHLIEVQQDRMEPHAMCQEVISLNLQHEPMGVVFERLGVGKGLGTVLDDMADEQNTGIPFVEDPVSSNTAKTVRIQSLEPVIAAGRLHFPGECYDDLFGGFKKLYDLLMEFRTDRRPKKCDSLDALSMFIKVASPPPKIQSREKRERSRFDRFQLNDDEEDAYWEDDESMAAEATGAKYG